MRNGQRLITGLKAQMAVLPMRDSTRRILLQWIEAATIERDSSDAFVQELSEGQCECVLPAPSGMITVDPLMGTLRYHWKPQERTVCVSCRARKAIVDDGVSLSEAAIAQQKKIRKVAAT